MSFLSVILVCPFNLPFGGTFAIYLFLVFSFGLHFGEIHNYLFSILVCIFGLLFLSTIMVCPFVLPYGETLGELFFSVPFGSTILLWI